MTETLSPAALELRCPACRGSLDGGAEELRCRGCRRAYPIVAGIPDLRLDPDPYLGIEADRQKGRRLAAAARGRSFAELLDLYYRITPEVPPDLARRYADHHRAGMGRGEAVLARLEAHGLSAALAAGPVLDLGCGTGGLLAAAARRGLEAAGVDIALRWLVVARHRLREAGLPDVPLVCAGAGRLPFAAGGFGLVVAEGLLEHTRDAAAVLAEARRVRHPAGAFLGRTVNRFAPGPEPHVGLWGVGFLPRRWMDPYVRWRRNLPYEHIHLRSYGELRRLLEGGGHDDLEVRAPRLSPADYAHHPPGRRRLFRIYAFLVEGVPLLRPLLRRVGPYLDVTSRVGG